MRFEPSDEQAQIRDMVRQVARKEFAPRAAEIDEQSRYPARNLALLAELGLLGMLYPAEYGGSEAGTVAYALALAEIAGGCASTSVGMAVTNMVGETIFRYGNEEQRRRFLPGLASGSGAGAFALTEPSAGSDAFGMSTSAGSDGDAYVLNGSKAFITNGSYAGVVIVMAVTAREPKKRISAFLVEPGTPGFSVGKPEHKMGLKGSDTVSLAFDDCRVPKRN
ncbi:MAG TPA: acyl-CoA dehydrogenase family protein, partial [Candidatus Deferrimicrobiaceae bacterium]|nr:acyl-CoA dehydrogenase family protein [Candidatus Deferrimicrobiaceae bacterium]